ncbi:MAG TPA: hypothetical protein VK453_13110 [Micromonosporaceae bacterium]|nr:hypothetical protein [Micromonosporaceae bacterium]
MRIGPADRIWVIGGAVSVVAVVAMGWFFLIGPQLSEASDLRSQAAESDTRIAGLEQRLTELRKQNEDLPRYQAQLAVDQQALPSTPSSADFLREFQVTGRRTDVVVSGITVGAPTQVVGGAAGVSTLPVILTASGSSSGLNELLDELQQQRPRAVLINTASLAPAGEAGGPVTSYTLTVNMQAFVAATGAATGTEPATTTN